MAGTNSSSTSITQTKEQLELAAPDDMPLGQQNTVKTGANDAVPRNDHENVVEFSGPKDPYNPQNWSLRKKIVTTTIYSLATMCTTWASSAYTSGIAQVREQFHVGNEVAILGLTFYLLGNAFGPLIWAPMSEAYGRKLSTLTLPIFGLMVFSFATATAQDLQTVLITRFFAGVFGVAPLSNVGGVLVDVWPASERGAALLTWGIAVIAGPLIAPVVGGALVLGLPETGWRWTEYVTGILAAAVLIIGLAFIEESSPPALLARKATRIRFETKNWAVRSKSQEADISLASLWKKYFIVPLEMLIDPICLLINIYAAFVYAIIYLAITSFPIEFSEVCAVLAIYENCNMLIDGSKMRRWGPVTSSLPFLAILIGALLGAGVNYWGQGFYRKRQAATGLAVVPEARLVPMIIGTFLFAPGLFIMGWTASADIPWIGFCIGAACVGFGFFTIFQSAIIYLVDTYLALAASALASNMLMRSILAAAFPLFADPMFHNLGLNWGMSLLGFISVVMMPIPFLFYIYGRKIRAKGKRSKMSFVA